MGRGAMNAPGEDAAISRDSLPLASRGFRMVERDTVGQQRRSRH